MRLKPESGYLEAIKATYPTQTERVARYKSLSKKAGSSATDADIREWAALRHLLREGQSHSSLARE